jgi:hypothetical protein
MMDAATFLNNERRLRRALTLLGITGVRVERDTINDRVVISITPAQAEKLADEIADVYGEL